MKYRNYIFLFIVLTLLFSCNKKKENNQETKQENLDETVNEEVFSKLESQEIHWSNKSYDIVKYEFSEEWGIDKVYSLSLFENGITRIRMIYDGPRIFLVVNNVTRFEYTDDEQYHYILHFNDGTQRNNWFYSYSGGFKYLRDDLSRIDEIKLIDVYYYHHYISSVLDIGEIKNLDLLQVILNNKIDFHVSDYDLQEAIYELFRIAEENGGLI